MNSNANTPKNQAVNATNTFGRKVSGRQRAAGCKKKAVPQRLTPEAQTSLQRKAEEIQENLQARTWRHLETKGKFTKNEKLSFINDEMLIVGCDIGSETHYARAIDTRGRELSSKAFSFENTEAAFQAAVSWAVSLAAQHEKKQIVLGLEPTGHYWFVLAAWMVSKGISVVQVNPYAVKQSKEIEDNSQSKDDRKDPKVIANLVKDGNYGMPYLPEGIYADIRAMALFRDQLIEDRGRYMNRLHREMTIVFPEYKAAFSKIDGPFTLSLLKAAPLPTELSALGEEGIRAVWHGEKLKGAGYRRAKEIVRYAAGSVGLTEGAKARKTAIMFFAGQIETLTAEIEAVEAALAEKCQEIPSAENVLEIAGLGERITSGILAEMGDIDRFDDAKEIQKLSGLGLVAISSGKHKGQTKISHRGRKRLRYWLFQGAMSVVSHNEAFRKIHEYYTTRAVNPLKKMQSLIVIACKLLRIIFTILKKGVHFDPDRMLRDIIRPEPIAAAA